MVEASEQTPGEAVSAPAAPAAAPANGSSPAPNGEAPTADDRAGSSPAGAPAGGAVSAASKAVKSVLSVLLGLAVAIAVTAALGFAYNSLAEASLSTKLILGISAAVSTILLLLWKVPKWQVAYLKDAAPDVRFEMENEARRTLAQIVAGVLVLSGIYGTWRTLQVSEQSQITERFNKAIDQLGSDKPTLRLGAIYSLERIMEDSPRDQSRVVELLATYVRENAPLRKPAPPRPAAEPSPKPATGEAAEAERGFPPADIQAVLNVLRRRKAPASDSTGASVDLREVRLLGADLSDAHLPRANFLSSDLSKARFWETNLAEALFIGTNLRGASFLFADLRGADFTLAYLEDADFNGADLGEADLRDARGHTAEQLKDARNVDTARLPPSIAEELRPSPR